MSKHPRAHEAARERTEPDGGDQKHTQNSSILIRLLAIEKLYRKHTVAIIYDHRYFEIVERPSSDDSRNRYMAENQRQQQKSESDYSWKERGA